VSPAIFRDHEDREESAKGTKKNILVFFVCFVDLRVFVVSTWT